MSRRSWIVAALAGLALVITPIGVTLALTDGDEPAASKAPEGFPLVGSSGEEMQAFQDCLAGEGVEPPDPGTAPESGEMPPGAPPEDLQRAFEACADEVPEGVPSPGQGPSVMPYGSPG